MRRQRQFVAPDFKITDWENLEPYFKDLLEMPIESVADLEKWLLKESELTYVVAEDQAWRFIHMTCDTEDEARRERYQYFLRELMPQLSVLANQIRKKLYENDFFPDLDPHHYEILIRSVRNRIELFREENVDLQSAIRQKSQQYDETVGGMFVEEDGKKMTLQQAAAELESDDRDYRERIWRKINAAWATKAEPLNALFSELTEMRHQVASNAGEPSYSAFKFRELERFDYSRADCEQFHHAIETVVTPVLIELSHRRRDRLGLDRLQPWDLTVDEFGEGRLRPFQNAEELIAKTIEIFGQVDSDFGKQINIMREIGYLDLDSRLGKAPGGYNYGLPESGIPFIFMNAVGTHTDLTTMLHEGGHAIHSFATNHLRNSYFSKIPSEVAELASMSMELIGLDFLDAVYEDPRQRQRACRDQITRIFTLLPWIATIDAFQFWVYDHPKASYEERQDAWISIFERFHGDYTAWKELNPKNNFFWHKQGHVFDVPFYYVEYGFAQLGAIAVWRNFRSDREKALRDYRNALNMGYTRPIPEIYAQAGIRFDFSESYIRELVDFLRAELETIEASM